MALRKIYSLFALCGASLAAQTFYIPDNQATTGPCNVIPFGSTTVTSGFYTCLTQQIYTAAELGSAPGVITGIEFAPCGTGKSRFTELQIVLDHLPPASTLSATFASNLSPNAVTVLDADNYVWHTTANTWAEVGLQNFFVYDGVSDLVVQVLANQSLSPRGFHRSTTHPRIYATGWVGSPPATGFGPSVGAQKVGISMLMARASTYGDGCVGSNALVPKMTLSGLPQLGQTVNLDLAQGPSSSVAFLVAGFGNGAPFPLELSGYGMPLCYQYFTPVATQLRFTNGTGNAVFPFAVPNNAGVAGILLYSQWVCLDTPANALGITTSDYARLLFGN